MSDKPGRDARGRPGIGTTRPPRQPAQQQPQPDDGSRSTGSASGAQPPPRPATGQAPRGRNVNNGPSSTGPAPTGFRAARPALGGKLQASAPLLTRGRAQPQPQPQPQLQPQNQTGADAATSTSLAEDDEDDEDDAGQTTTTTTVPQPTAAGGVAKPAQTGGVVTRQRTGFRTGPTPGRVANPTPVMARDRAQPLDRSEDEAASDGDVDTKDADLDTGVVLDPGSQADDASDTSSESSEVKQPVTKAPSRPIRMTDRSARATDAPPMPGRQ
ncbi:MAG TPA: hypothetical protein VFE41_10705 [Acetobacteraceae bacterium]|nr:hypothetical protein [Acetobacteraceae bacterium]